MSTYINDNFSNIKDPRIERRKLHSLPDILVLTICAMLSGADGDGAGKLLAKPRSVAVDANGNVYVAGEETDNVFQITSGGFRVTSGFTSEALVKQRKHSG